MAFLVNGFAVNCMLVGHSLNVGESLQGMRGRRKILNRNDVASLGKRFVFYN